VSPAPTPSPTAAPTPPIEPAPEATPTVEPDPFADPHAPPSGAPDPVVGEPSSAPVVGTSPRGDQAPSGPGTRDPIAGRGATDPTNRWIVVLKAGSDVTATADRQGRRIGFTFDRSYRNAFRGYSATLDRSQVTALSHDPLVAMIVADEKIEAESQTMPTGISRVFATKSSVAKIDGLDQRVDADVAIVDTGVARVADLNVAGGYNCSTSDRSAWRDVYGHGTHVAGTVGALDNGFGVVGVAPGVRIWGVKILNDNGEGLLSWYVCGLDWIAAQHDPLDPTRPLFEAVNMSVAKYGKDDTNCGMTNKDILHVAICRLVGSGVTVVAAAANDSSTASARVPAAYNEVITVSALADTDGKPGGLGGNRCYSWGTYDRDDTFANFSNYGSDVDLIAPGKCIWSTVPGGYKYSSGTSMAAPHVTGAAALLKASRPGLTPAEVREALQYLGNLNWKTSTDPDSHHERLLDVSKIGPRGDFSVTAGSVATVGEAGGSARFPVTIARTPTSFERIRLSVTGLPDGATAAFAPASLYGFAGVASTLTVTVPRGLAPGSYPITISASEHGTIHTSDATIVAENDLPTALPPATAALVRGILSSTTVPTRVSWPAATDPSTGIAGYELQMSEDGGTWIAASSTSSAIRSATASHDLGHAYQYRVRAQDGVGNWSAWASGPIVTGALLQDRATAVTYSGTWKKSTYVNASGGSTTYATSSGARVRTTFSGRGIAMVAPVGTTRGSARIYIDGAYRTTVSFRASSGRSRVVMFSTTFATLGTHTIDVRLVGNGRVDLDAFVILR
ncbi:MAG: S8 family serine peptidase, partial [Chloroflexi bacterium]|nr:S8 family serine peptidase [Chloroflexota bacterium]